MSHSITTRNVHWINVDTSKSEFIFAVSDDDVDSFIDQAYMVLGSGKVSPRQNQVAELLDVVLSFADEMITNSIVKPGQTKQDTKKNLSILDLLELFDSSVRKTLYK